MASLAGGLSLGGVAALPAAASANSSQLAIIQDGSVLSNPGQAMKHFRSLGANTVRVIVEWAHIAPNAEGKKPKGFNATNPNSYPAANWAPIDNIARAAAANHIKLDFTLSGGAPLWAENTKGLPKQGRNPEFAWKPNAGAYGQFVTAVAKRYSGSFAPTGQGKLPAVKFWAIYNEPNFGEDLGPQAIHGSRVSYAPLMYRGLLNAGWKALHRTLKHPGTIIWGEFAARGNNFHKPWKKGPEGLPGDYGQTKPLEFLRTLYCVSSKYRPLRGGAARAVGCPTTARAARSFRRNNPALFSASGVSDHPYAANGSPVRDGLNDPNFAAFPALGKFGRELDRLNRTYGSRTHFAVYNTEYGYITNPPSYQRYVSPTTAAYYLNWAEYISYKNRRVKSYMQYLLTDPPATAGAYAGFASGLETATGRPKPAYYAYRMPLYLPHTSFSHRSKVEVWGAVRPAPFAAFDKFGTQRARLQEKVGKGGWKTLTTFKVNHAGGYYDLHERFARSGLLRVQWTFPKDGRFDYPGLTASSRTVKIKVH